MTNCFLENGKLVVMVIYVRVHGAFREWMAIGGRNALSAVAAQRRKTGACSY